MNGWEEWRLTLPAADGQHRLRCHHQPGHLAVRVPRGVTALCCRCVRPLRLAAWADDVDQAEAGLVLCGRCHAAIHGWDR